MKSSKQTIKLTFNSFLWNRRPETVNLLEIQACSVDPCGIQPNARTKKTLTNSHSNAHNSAYQEEEAVGSN